MNHSDDETSIISELFEHSVLQALRSSLHLAMTTLLELYPFCDEERMEKGGYEAHHAFSRALINQIHGLEDTLRLYERCLEARDRAASCVSLEDTNDIPF